VTSVKTRTRIAIVDHHVLFAECLEVALRLRGHELRLVPVSPGAHTLAPVLTAVLRAHPQIAIIDLDLGTPRVGETLIEPVARSGTAVVVITEDPDSARWGECLLLGARIVLPKNGELSTITSAIRRITDGSPLMPRETFQGLVRRYHEADRGLRELRARLERLSAREGEVLSHLMAGRSVSDIAHIRVVSEATVRTQVKFLLRKLEVSSQVAAVGLANRANWRPSTMSEQQRKNPGSDAGPPAGLLTEARGLTRYAARPRVSRRG
jgi:two-component system nitrate/nitrite response regulator NarL